MRKKYPEIFTNISDTNNKYIAELLVQKYFVSSGWEKHHIIIDEEYTTESLKKVTLQWKLGFIQKMMKDNLLKMKKAVDQQEIDALLDIQVNIDRYKNQYAGELGIVILPTTKLLEV